jgi:hypothetical protein
MRKRKRPKKPNQGLLMKEINVSSIDADLLLLRDMKILWVNKKLRLS